MTAKEFLDKKFGRDRAHARNLPVILEEYAAIKNREIVDWARVILEHAGVEYVKEIAKEIINEYGEK